MLKLNIQKPVNKMLISFCKITSFVFRKHREDRERIGFCLKPPTPIMLYQFRQ
jgi:hypothetical protein